MPVSWELLAKLALHRPNEMSMRWGVNANYLKWLFLDEFADIFQEKVDREGGNKMREESGSASPQVNWLKVQYAFWLHRLKYLWRGRLVGGPHALLIVFVAQLRIPACCPGLKPILKKVILLLMNKTVMLRRYIFKPPDCCSKELFHEVSRTCRCSPHSEWVLEHSKFVDFKQKLRG